MKKVKIAELSGPPLDWAVAKCEGFEVYSYIPLDLEYVHKFRPSTDWSQGGPIIEREKIGIYYYECPQNPEVSKQTPWLSKLPYPENWRAYSKLFSPVYFDGPTPLIAALRCYVTSKLGDEIEILKELL